MTKADCASRLLLSPIAFQNACTPRGFACGPGWQGFACSPGRWSWVPGARSMTCGTSELGPRDDGLVDRGRRHGEEGGRSCGPGRDRWGAGLDVLVDREDVASAPKHAPQAACAGRATVFEPHTRRAAGSGAPAGRAALAGGGRGWRSHLGQQEGGRALDRHLLQNSRQTATEVLVVTVWGSSQWSPGTEREQVALGRDTPCLSAKARGEAAESA